MKKFEIRKISELSEETLKNFYSRAFKFDTEINENYRWRYRIGYKNFEPLVLIVDNKIVGHAGLIPISIRVKEKIEDAIWFTDFYVNSNSRSLGYGQALTDAWMKICPLQITLCNEDSLKIFKKFKWKSNSNYYRQIKPIKYLNFLSLFKKPNKNLQISPILEKKIIDLVKKIEKNSLNKKDVEIVRNEEWFKWRLLECPYKKDILIFEYENEYLLGHIYNKENFKRMNVLFSTKKSNSEIYKLVTLWSLKNKIDYISFVDNKNKTNKLLKLPYLTKKINFAYFSKNDLLLNKIEQNIDDIQYIDSDIDYIN
tara:strand:- start:94 stop:1029 length:936 start_codon:yes stop_codon:yes gene_type:complete